MKQVYKARVDLFQFFLCCMESLFYLCIYRTVCFNFSCVVWKVCSIYAFTGHFINITVDRNILGDIAYLLALQDSLFQFFLCCMEGLFHLCIYRTLYKYHCWQKYTWWHWLLWCQLHEGCHVYHLIIRYHILYPYQTIIVSVYFWSWYELK